MGRASESRPGSQENSHILWSTVKALNPKKPITPTNTTITQNNKTADTDTKNQHTKQILQINHKTLLQPNLQNNKQIHQITHIYPNNNHRNRNHSRYKTI